MKKKILKMSILTIIAICFTVNAYCQIYNYPIKPESNEWRQLKSHDEMIIKCQISDSVLSTISTKDLLESCLSYPLFLDMLAYNNIKDGFEKMSSKSNAFQELMKRSDLSKFLVGKYKEIKIEELINNPVSSQRGYYTFIYSAIELMLADSRVLNSLNGIEKKLLLKDVVGKYDLKMKQKEIYGALGQLTSAYLTAKVLSNIDIKDWDLYIKNNIGVKDFTDKMEVINLRACLNFFNHHSNGSHKYPALA